MSGDGSVRVDQISLDVFGHRIAIVSDDPAITATLKTALSGLLADDAAPVGFALRSPRGRETLHLLLDRSGLVLGRSRGPHGALSSLARHLGVFAPRPEGTIRFRMRALVGPDGRAVLAGFPLFSMPPAVERRLVAKSYRLVDRLAVDLSSSGSTSFEAFAIPGLEGLPAIEGHTGVPSGPLEIAKVLLPGTQSGKPTLAQAVTAIAATSADGDIAAAVEVAKRLAARTEVVPFDGREPPYRGLLGTSAATV